MATQDVEDVVDETPATHKLKAQKWGIVLAAAIVCALFVSVAVKMAKKPSLPVAEMKQPESGPKTTAATSEDDFQARLAREERRRELEKASRKDNAEQGGEDTLTRLEKLREEQALKAGKERDPASKAKNPPVPNATQSPLQQWEDRELLRSYESRHSALKVQILPGTAGPAALNAPPARGSAAKGPPLIPSPNALQSEQQGVQAELARIQSLRTQLESGGLSGSDLADAFSGMAPTGAPNPIAPNAAPKAPPAARAGQTVGQPASAKSRKPGDALVSVGTVGRAVLDQDVISDYPGAWRGLIIDDIYDVTNRAVVVPRGSRIVGDSVRITNVNEPISARMGLLIKWIVLPDGSKISLDRSAALDAAGVAGIKDKVNRHIVAQVLGVAAYALVSAETSRTGSGALQETSFEGDIGDSLRKQFAPIAQKYLSLVPTITLRSGTPIRIFIEDDIYAQPWSDVNADLVHHASR